MPTDPSRLVENLYHSALKLDPSKRAAFLDKACLADGRLRREVESLIASNEQATEECFLGSADMLPVATRLSEMLIGQVLDDKYQIEKLLGQGGMGAVYLATHLGTGRPVALKVIAPQFMSDEEFVQRFKREAKAAGLLRHPNVVNVTDFGFAKAGSDQVAYLVMEYLDGSTLGDLLKKRGHLPLEFVVDIVEQVSLALDEAHKNGIIHRDLKPDNIWLEPDWRGGYNVKVLDFGIAKLRDVARPGFTDDAAVSDSFDARSSTPSAVEETWPAASPGDRARESQGASEIMMDSVTTQLETRLMNRGATDGSIEARTILQWLTRAGTILGTPLYMLPEQCLGNELDARSDVYSLGIVTYQMLTGETPFSGDLFEIIQKHSVMPPTPIRDKRREIPKAVAGVVMSALSKNPGDRHRSAGAFAAALRTTAEGVGPILKEASALYRRHRGLFVRMVACVYGTVIIFLLLLLCGIAFGPQGPRRPLSFLFWVVSLLLLLVANVLNTAACSIAVKHLRADPKNSPSVHSVLRELRRRIGRLAITAFIANAKVLLRLAKLTGPRLIAYRDYSLYPVVVMLEGTQGSAALRRSELLVQPVRSLFPHLLAREKFETFIGVFAGVMAPTIGLQTWEIFSKHYEKDVFKGALDLLSILMNYLPWELISLAIFVSVVIMGSSTGISFVLLYERASEVLGEPIAELVESRREPDLSRGARTQQRRTVAYLTAILLTVIFWINTFFYAHLGEEFWTPIVFLALGASANTKGSYAPLFQRDDLGVVRALIAAGADVNAKDDEGSPLLMSGLGHGFPSIEKARLLISAGTDVDATDRDGNTALLKVAKWSTVDYARVLVEGGANVNATDNKGVSVLMYAAMLSGWERRHPFVEMLIGAGADPNLRDADGKTALMYATEPYSSRVFDTVTKDFSLNYTIVQMLIDAGADVRIKDRVGRTALSYAEDGPTTSLLVSAGADVRATDSGGVTVLMGASHEKAKVLIDAGADVNAQDKRGQTALMGHPSGKAVKVLIAAGANVNVKDKTAIRR